MILIYGKGKVGKGIAGLCEFLHLDFEMKDDADSVDFSCYEKIIPSPGIPAHHKVYKSGNIVSELDFVSLFLPKGFHIVAVTGTDGKSTTSWILYELLRQEFGDEKVYLSGNFDVPFSETLRQILEKKQKSGYIVVEVSSFMAYTLTTFQPEYTLFTNFKPDHLNWHKDLEAYLDAKMNLFSRAQKKAIINQQILNFAEENNLKLKLGKNTRVYYDRELYAGFKVKDWTNGEDISISGRKKYKLSETHFSGMHNALNILSATLVTNEMGICSKRTKEYLNNITGLPHRLEKIGEHNGIIFVEDSKSTSAQSLEAALSSYGNLTEKNLLLIVGGSDKGDEFDSLSVKLKSRAKALVCIGATKEKFIRIARTNDIPYFATDSLSEGVNWLYNKAGRGDVLMLSPGCASFGLFRDYLDRALQFRDAIKKLQ